ncbi:protein kinase domain-containing protein [Haematococcus lacustris]|uniref:Protein kinase domain-containing protein n=1 Tax=Haematococcus lacustris TaxID=44745 RepID=A0A699YVN9_HAELA|nr:protein kinase domain-containing protein [Haematococcus lacustris]
MAKDVKPANIFLTLQPGGTPGLMGTLADDDGAAAVPLLYKLGDYGTMRESGRKHLHYFVSGFG